MEDNIKSFSETCNTIRHYSNLSFSVRILSIVQGLTLVAAWTLNYNAANFTLLFAVPGFGIVLTWLIYKFHMGYYDSTGFFIDRALEMEENLFDDDFRTFHKFRVYHNKKYKSRLSKFIVLNAPFTLIGVLFVVLFVLTMFKYHNIIQ